ncbi:hypothetical protein SAMN04488118_1272 [Epibacterium ulvae]|uniref:Uncharacterized protein n=1 Tax=Epibacterium ulvae TaxID=1156985 RepID=A0A1G5RKG9_9RHOB|nr:hypothetical protein [Epibacterium ulvae]SCZ74310.1 hypothetical protein SAMN04488118_1272 [Epibacterium ulvae]
MAKDLKLKTERINDTTVRVSWTDPVLGDFSKGNSNMLGAIAGIGFLICMGVGLVNQTFTPLLVGFALIIGCLVMLKTTRMVDRQIVFDPETTLVEGRRYPTDQITRFEYGLRSQLTGEQPYRDPKSGAVHSDPTLIRMWLNDSDALQISINNWQPQVCHKIRNALDEALLFVRKEQKQADHREKYGSKGDFGMPEY